MQKSRNALRASAGATAALVGCSMLVTSGSAGEHLVQLNKPPPMAGRLAAIPRIAAPADAAEQKINAAVARLDAKARKAKDECRAENKDFSWGRSVRVPMRGPRFISYVITDDTFCGAYPDVSTMSIVYDLTTGRPVDWDKLLPPSLAGKPEPTATHADETRVVLLSGKTLFELYMKRYPGKTSRLQPDGEADCREILPTARDDGEQPDMMAWPDAKDAALVVAPVLPHVSKACAQEIAIPVSMLKAEGAKPLLIDAIEAAHRDAALHQ